MGPLTSVDRERAVLFLRRMRDGLRLAEATGDPIAGVIRECIAGVEQGAAAGDMSQVEQAVVLLTLQLKVWEEA